MMRHLFSAMLLVAGGWMPLLAGPASLDLDKLVAAIDEHCPGAEISRSADSIQARRNAMLFTIHNSSKTDRWLPTTHQEEGPRPGGFILLGALVPGQAPPSQALKGDSGWVDSPGPYFETWWSTIPADGGQAYWDIHLSVSDLDRECTHALFSALTPDGTTAAQGSPP